MTEETEGYVDKLVPVEHRVLSELQQEGRLSNAELAQRVNALESSCSRHRRRLEAAGIIAGYVAVLAQDLAGFAENVFVSISLHDQREEHLAEFQDALADVPQVMECYALAGDTDYLLRVVAKDAHHYDLVRARVAQLPRVERLHSEVVLRTVFKKTHAAGAVSGVASPSDRPSPS